MEGYKAHSCAHRQVASRQSTVSVAARHVHRSRTSHIKRRAKKRDIRTSFIKSSSGPLLIQAPSAVSTLPSGWGPLPQIAAVPVVPLPSVPQPDAAAAPPEPAVPRTAISLGEPCRTSRPVSQPVVAIAAATRPAAEAVAAVPVSDADEGADVAALPVLPPRAALDSILDGLIVAPTTATPVGASSSPNSSNSSSSSSSAVPSKSSTNSRSGKKKGSSAAAAAAPAVVNIQCEVDWARELAAAAAHDQLVVVKVESGRNQLMRPAADPTLRFQTHNVLPTPLNTYLPHGDSSSFSSFAASSALSSLGINLGLNSPSQGPGGVPAAVGSSLSSLDASFTRSVLPTAAGLDNLASLGLYGLSASSSSSSMSSSSLSASLASSNRLDSPVHQWYMDLAGQYVSGSSNKGLVHSPLRFLSLQSDTPRAKALCRKLGVSECLSVLVVDPSTGRKMLEVCGTKIEQELPSGLLYYADADPEGRHPSDLLKPINTKAELEEVRSSSDVAVVAFHMHAAPPCIKTYGVLYEAARTHRDSSVSFAVMDISSSREHSDLATELDLQRLPTYVIYKGGQEVARLARTSERKRLGQVLKDVLAESAVAVAAA